MPVEPKSATLVGQSVELLQVYFELGDCSEIKKEKENIEKKQDEEKSENEETVVVKS